MMADVAVVPVPDEDQLVRIAHTTARNYQRIFEREPAVAFLSFSSHGSADHPSARAVAAAAQRLATLEPAWTVVGEVQADAALVPEIARTKGIDWEGRRGADVLVFPDLASGNIGQKLVERLGRWRTVGPWFQGLRRPLCGLSRGCTALDIYDGTVLATLA
jgi:phosphotransacetylase